MEAQKHLLKMSKDGKEQAVWIDGQVRILPFGIVEYIFPKEDKARVFNTLVSPNKNPYGMAKALDVIRRFLRHKKIKHEITDDGRYLWNMEHVAILLIGYKEDGEIVGSNELDGGWTHEAL